MRILVTGANGFIAKHLIDKLLKLDYKVRATDLNFSGRKNPKVQYVKADLLKPPTVKNLCNNIDSVIHLAGAFNPPFENLLNLNVLTTYNLLEECVRSKVKKFIFSSTCAVYNGAKTTPNYETQKPNPDTPYGVSKYLAELTIKHFSGDGFIYDILRFPNVYGPQNQKGVVYLFCNAAINNLPITIYGEGKQKRDFLYVSDAVEAIIKSLKRKDNKSEIFNITSGNEVTLQELVKMIEKTIGKNITINHAPSEGEKVQVLQGDISKAKLKLKWTPKISLVKGIKETLNYLK